MRWIYKRGELLTSYFVLLALVLIVIFSNAFPHREIIDRTEVFRRGSPLPWEVYEARFIQISPPATTAGPPPRVITGRYEIGKLLRSNWISLPLNFGFFVAIYFCAGALTRAILHRRFSLRTVFLLIVAIGYIMRISMDHRVGWNLSSIGVAIQAFFLSIPQQAIWLRYHRDRQTPTAA